MDTFWRRAAWGLCLVQLSLAQIDLNITCRYAGIFHVEKNGRYSISKTEAADLCKAFNCTLPTMAQMEAALRVGFETCRYGFIDGHVVIPRIHPNSVCAANNTGVYILTSNTSQYDTYCFNASAPLEEDCTSVTDLPNAFEGPITITIVNRDGTRYTKKGEYRTNPDDINPSTAPEEDMSSGSSSERSTSGGYNIFHTHLPTVYPTLDQDSPRVSSNPEITSTTSRFSTTAPPGKPTTALMSTSGTTSKTATKRQEAQDWFSWWFQPSTSKIHLHTTTIMAGMDSNIISAGWEPTEENEDESDRHPSYSGSGIDDDEDFISSTTRAPPTSTTEETATQKEQWFENGWPGENPQMPKEDSHSTAGTTAASAHDSHPNQRVTTQSQEDRSWTYFFDPVSHPMGRGHQTERRMDMDTSHSTTLQPPADPNTGLVEDLDRTGPLSVTTQQSDTQSFSTSHGGLEEDKDHPMTATPTSSNRNDDRGGRRGGNLPEDSTTSVEGYTPYSPDTNEYRTLIPVTPAKTGSPEVTEVTIVGESTSNVDLSLPEDQDLSHDPSGRSYTTHGSESAGHSSGSQERGTNTTSGPMRKPQIPEWLIILASLLALALILAVCIAVNSRRRCGQKKKLVINNGNGTVEERKPSGLNGEASKSQEMVHLVNKESSGTPDQFMTTDERRNLQNVDMKIGV
ncbi:CD44 antigen isoform X5 [Eubalaena glacialis]|uniref:CD44 antigen isoform X5 n=1 Tax=Eubalaena glacialis TaxID=27606 RepID=UPI002A5AF621|nr:CD44 antigen isoform X5 [Eubalaena glacialis]